jgi:hypothetical protein
MAIMFAIAGPVVFVQAAAEAPPAATITAEQKAALDVLDGVIVRFEALLAKDDDAAHHATTKGRLDEFKERRDALRTAYDQARYEELRTELNLEY